MCCFEVAVEIAGITSRFECAAENGIVRAVQCVGNIVETAVFIAAAGVPDKIIRTVLRTVSAAAEFVFRAEMIAVSVMDNPVIHTVLRTRTRAQQIGDITYVPSVAVVVYLGIGAVLVVIVYGGDLRVFAHLKACSRSRQGIINTEMRSRSAIRDFIPRGDLCTVSRSVQRVGYAGSIARSVHGNVVVNTSAYIVARTDHTVFDGIVDIVVVIIHIQLYIGGNIHNTECRTPEVIHRILYGGGHFRSAGFIEHFGFVYQSVIIGMQGEFGFGNIFDRFSGNESLIAATRIDFHCHCDRDRPVDVIKIGYGSAQPVAFAEISYGNSVGVGLYARMFFLPNCVASGIKRKPDIHVLIGKGLVVIVRQEEFVVETFGLG